MTHSPMRPGIYLALLTAVSTGCATIETPAPSVGPQSSWGEIRSTPGLIVLGPQIFFGTRGVSVTDLCLSGDKLRAPRADGGAAEVTAAGHQLRYMIRVGIPAGDGETSTIRVLFAKPFDIPACT